MYKLKNFNPRIIFSIILKYVQYCIYTVIVPRNIEFEYITSLLYITINHISDI